MMQSLPVQMHPRYNEFLEFLNSLKTDARKNVNALNLAFDVWLKLNSFDVEKAVLIADMSVMATYAITQKDETIAELKKDLDRKHRECAERERQCALQAEYIAELVQDGTNPSQNKNTSIQARIDGLRDVFMLASIVQFKYVQDISAPNEVNFKVSMAGGHYTHGKPEQYEAFMDKYLTWLESR